MKITFYIKYHTTWGQRLFISGSCAKLGSGTISAAKEMHYADNGEWQLEISLPDTTKEIRYFYILEDENGIRQPEPESGILKLDNAKIREAIGCRPRWNVDMAMKATVEWELGRRDGKPVRALMEQQIGEYHSQ